MGIIKEGGLNIRNPEYYTEFLLNQVKPTWSGYKKHCVKLDYIPQPT